MQNKYDRWDLTYLYPDFDDEQFKADLASLKEDAKKGMALLEDASLTRLVRLEQAVAHAEQVSAKVDRLANFIQCTLAVDATHEKANAAMDQLMMAFTELELSSSALSRFVAETEDLERLIESSDVLRSVSFATPLARRRISAASIRSAKAPATPAALFPPRPTESPPP